MSCFSVSVSRSRESTPCFWALSLNTARGCARSKREERSARRAGVMKTRTPLLKSTSAGLILLIIDQLVGHRFSSHWRTAAGVARGAEIMRIFTIHDSKNWTCCPPKGWSWSSAQLLGYKRHDFVFGAALSFFRRREDCPDVEAMVGGCSVSYKVDPRS